MSILFSMKFSALLIFFLAFFSFSIGVTFAESWKEASGTTKTEISAADIINESIEESEAKKQKIKDEISSYIIESYKVQWDKIIKDIELTLQKSVPIKSDRIIAYQKIQSSLDARKTRNKESKIISNITRDILDAFLTHMIESLGKKIKELS